MDDEIRASRAETKSTVLIYGLSRRESKKQLTEVFRAYLSQNRVVGDKFEAWKLYDTSCSFRYTKNLGE